jgi:dienelactone hydrolase
MNRLAICCRIVAALVLTLALAAPADAKRKRHTHKRAPVAYVADGSLKEWRGSPTYLAGRSQVSRGELIYTDYLFDDYGPDLNGGPDTPAFRSTLAPTNGDYRYPDDPARYGYNAADLRELRIAADANALHALIGLETMKVADAAIATIAIDTDGNASTGAAEWPDGAGIATPGADRFITTWGTGAHVVDAAGKSTTVRTAVNLDENAIEVDVPADLLGAISGNARVWVVTGLDKAGGGGFEAQKNGATAVFNVGFRGDDDWPRLIDHWGEHEQSQTLAKRDVSAFARKLDYAALRARQTIPFDVKPGFYDRTFRSKYHYGEGIDLKQSTPGGDGTTSGTAAPMFLSDWQTYGIYIPKGYDPAKPAALLLDGHSLDVNHNEYRDVAPKQYTQLGDDRGSIVFTPLARGIDTWYLDAGFADVMEAWDDVKAHYAVDDDRTSITGYSMGGYMTYRLGLLMPDRFARASVWVGPPAYSIWPYPLPIQSTPDWLVPGNTNQIVRNALNLPYEITSGNADELVPIAGVQHQVDTMMAAGDDVTFHRHFADDHLSFILADEWATTKRFLGDAHIDHSPVEVRYRRYPSMDLPKYGFKFDKAYWVSGLDVRDAKAADSFGEIDAVTYALGGHERALSAPEILLEVGTAGLTPAIETAQHVVAGKAIEQRNGFRATFTNLSAATLDTATMGLDLGSPIVADLHGDGALTLTLRGRFVRGAKATLDGAALAGRRMAGGALVLPVTLAGQRAHELRIVNPRRAKKRQHA